MRCFFIPGLGEDPFIFEKIAGGLPGDPVHLSLWTELPQRHTPGINVSEAAKALAIRYDIGAGDVVIGHSTGGWLALYLKALTGCRIVQIASWTDQQKVVAPVRSRRLIYLAARTGLYLNRFMLRMSIRRFYEGKPSKEVCTRVFERLISGNRANAVNQLRVVFNPAPAVSVQPDLRIHGRSDRIVRVPDAPFVEVPGDHFSLYTHPEAVREPLLHFMTRSYEQQ